MLDIKSVLPSQISQLRQSPKAVRLIWTAVLSFLCFWNILAFYIVVFEPLQHVQTFAYRDESGLARVSDFVQFYSAGAMIVCGDRFRVYDPQVQMKYISQLIEPLTIDRAFYFQDVPFIFPVMAPLALLPLKFAYVLWCLLSVAFGSTCMAVFLKRWARWECRYIALFLLMVACSLPSMLVVRLGQTGWLNTGLVVLYCWGLLAEKDLMAGTALAFTTIKPQYSLILGSAALGSKRWRMLSFAVAVEIGLFILAGLTIGWQNIIGFPSIVHEAESSSRYGGVNPEAMVSVRFPLTLLFGTVAGLNLGYAFMATGMAAVAVLWLDGWQRGEESRRWLAAITALTTLTLSPHSHRHDLLLLAVPALLTARPGKFSDSPTSGLLKRSWYALLYSLPVLGFFLHSISGEAGSWAFFCTNLVLLLLAVVIYLGQVRLRPAGRQQHKAAGA